MSEALHHLSKSRVMSGLQCERRLFLEVHRPDLQTPIPPARRALMESGRRTGEVARSFWPDGVLIGHQESLSAALRETQERLADRPAVPLFEAAFSYNGVAVRTDVLRPADGRYCLTEVKSASSVKRHFITDSAIQAWVARSSGLPLKRVELMHIDNGFVYPGNGDYRGLFKTRDITEPAAEAGAPLTERTARFQEMLKGPEPDIPPDEPCTRPHPCPFRDHCLDGREGPEYPVSDLPKGGRTVKQLEEKGIFEIPRIPDGFLQNPRHLMVWKAVRDNEPHLGAELKEYFRQLGFPRFYLDFETISFPVPVWKGTSPFKQYPFQYSCHLERRGGQLEHREFLDVSGGSPMRSLAERLLRDLGESGPIVVYSDFEKTVINLLARLFPDLAPRLKRLITRLADLLPVLQNSYYHPAMHGSWSIKSVLPTIMPDLDYGDLEEVTDGAGAQAAYLEAASPATPPDRREELERRMLDYCRMDTLAMVEIASRLGRA